MTTFQNSPHGSPLAVSYEYKGVMIFQVMIPDFLWDCVVADKKLWNGSKWVKAKDVMSHCEVKAMPVFNTEGN